MLAAVVAPEVLADESQAATPVLARLVLDGDFDAVTLRNVTLDPGGERARATPTAAVAVPLVRLEIEGQVGKLLIERCITGPIWETNNDVELCNAGQITLCDCIVMAPSLADVAIQTRLAHVSLSRCTVFGRVEVARLYASDSVLRGRTRVTDPQHGCFRYSSTSRDGAVLPRQFESFVPEGQLPAHWFRSQRFGEPGLAVLSPTAPDALTRGAENGAEMGVFNTRALTLRLSHLARQVRDLLPVGQTPQQIIEHAIPRTEDRS
jgi:hypothetical protein